MTLSGRHPWMWQIQIELSLEMAATQPDDGNARLEGDAVEDDYGAPLTDLCRIHAQLQIVGAQLDTTKGRNTPKNPKWLLRENCLFEWFHETLFVHFV